MFLQKGVCGLLAFTAQAPPSGDLRKSWKAMLLSGPGVAGHAGASRVAVSERCDRRKMDALEGSLFKDEKE